MDGDGLSAGTISQTFDTTVNNTYEASFSLSGNPDGGPATKTLTVSATGGLPVDYSFDTGIGQEPRFRHPVVVRQPNHREPAAASDGAGSLVPGHDWARRACFTAGPVGSGGLFAGHQPDGGGGPRNRESAKVDPSRISPYGFRTQPSNPPLAYLPQGPATSPHGLSSGGPAARPQGRGPWRRRLGAMSI